MFSIGDKKILNLPEQVEENVKDIDALNTKVDTMVDACKTATSTSETASANATAAVTTANEAKTTADEAKTTADSAKASAENISTENDATFGANVEVDGTLTLNSTTDIVFKDGSSFETGSVDLSNYVDLSSSQIITGQKEFHRTGSSTPYVFFNYEQSSDGIIVSSSNNPYQSGSFTGPLRALINAAYIEIAWAKGKERYMGTYRYDRYTYKPYSSGNATAFVFPISKTQGTYTLATTDDIPSVPTYYMHNLTINLIDENLDTASALIKLTFINQSATALTATTLVSALGTTEREATGIIFFATGKSENVLSVAVSESGYILKYIDTSAFTSVSEVSALTESSITLLVNNQNITDSVETL